MTTATMTNPIDVVSLSDQVIHASIGVPGELGYRYLGYAVRIRPGGTSGPWYWHIDVTGLQHRTGEARNKAEARTMLATLAEQAMVPVRVQGKPRRYTPLPEDTVYVGRGTKWDNPFRFRSRNGLARTPAVEDPTAEWEYEGRCSAAGAQHDYWHPGPEGRVTRCRIRYMTRKECTDLYQLALTGRTTPAMNGAVPSKRWLGYWEDDTFRYVTVDDVRRELRGKNLACTCPLNVSCHADILLAVANSVEEEGQSGD